MNVRCRLNRNELKQLLRLSLPNHFVFHNLRRVLSRIVTSEAKPAAGFELQGSLTELLSSGTSEIKTVNQFDAYHSCAMENFTEKQFTSKKSQSSRRGAF